MEDRIIELETRQAYHEQTISELNDALTSQQAQIMQLETLCESLVDRVRSLTEAVPGAANDEAPPPHY